LRYCRGDTEEELSQSIMRASFSSHEQYTIASAENSEIEINGQGGVHAH
jgi:hypothetical protein